MADLSEIRFGARVILRHSVLSNEWLFICWNKDDTKLWLARSEAGYAVRRGPPILCVEQERIKSFANVERYKPLKEVNNA